MAQEIALNAQDIKDRVSLTDLLSRLGHHPIKNTGRELVYLSMLRDSDTKPSFSVNEHLGVWYDHGLGKGGNVIDFGILFWRSLSFKEVLEKIMAVCDEYIPATVQSGKVQRKRSAVKIPHYEVQDTKELGSHPAITSYLQGRGIWDAAQGRMKEVYYYVEDQKKQRKYFYAAGWQNELGHWEVRNLYFKGCLGHKAITVIAGNEEKIAIFEGYINYLSWLTENPGSDDTILVLNSVSLIKSAIKKSGEFKEVATYFDRDRSGIETTREFRQGIPHALDLSETYLNYNDYNDKLVASSKGQTIS